MRSPIQRTASHRRIAVDVHVGGGHQRRRRLSAAAARECAAHSAPSADERVAPVHPHAAVMRARGCGVARTARQPTSPRPWNTWRERWPGRMSCTPVIMPVVITSPARSGRPRRAHLASAKASAPSGPLTQRRDAAADELVVDERLRSRLHARPRQSRHRRADDDAPVVAEIRDDRAGAELVQRRERAARDLDADAQLADELRGFVERPLDLVRRRVAADADHELRFDRGEAAFEDRAVDRAPGRGHVNVAARSTGPTRRSSAILGLLRRGNARDLPAADGVRPARDARDPGSDTRSRGRRARRPDTRGSARAAEPRAHELLGDAGDVARRRRRRLQMHRTARNVLISRYCIEETGVIYNCRTRRTRSAQGSSAMSSSRIRSARDRCC